MKKIISFSASALLLLLITFAPFLLSDMIARHHSDALRDRISVGMTWSDVGAQLESDPYWMVISFKPYSSQCGHIMRSPDGRTLIFYFHKKTERAFKEIEGFQVAEVRAQLESCPKISVTSHSLLSFTWLSFDVVFSPEGKVVSTESKPMSD